MPQSFKNSLLCEFKKEFLFTKSKEWDKNQSMPRLNRQNRCGSAKARDTRRLVLPYTAKGQSQNGLTDCERKKEKERERIGVGERQVKVFFKVDLSPQSAFVLLSQSLSLFSSSLFSFLSSRLLFSLLYPHSK